MLSPGYRRPDVGSAKNIHGIGRPTSTNIGVEFAVLMNGSAMMTGTVEGGCADHVSEGLAP